MNTTGTRKLKPANTVSDETESDNDRRTDEKAEQQDLDQGMSTGTHDTTRHGVNWGRAYRTRPKAAADKKQDKDTR